jgi:hypothetical protein
MSNHPRSKETAGLMRKTGNTMAAAVLAGNLRELWRHEALVGWADRALMVLEMHNEKDLVLEGKKALQKAIQKGS